MNINNDTAKKTEYSSVTQIELDPENNTKSKPDKSKPNSCTRFMRWVIKNPMLSVPLCLGLMAFGCGAGAAITSGMITIGAIGGLSNRKIGQVHNESIHSIAVINELESTILEPKAQKPKAQKPKARKPKAQKPKAQKPTTQKPTTQKPTTSKPTTSETTTSKLHKEAHCVGNKKTTWMRCQDTTNVSNGETTNVWLLLNPNNLMWKNEYGSCENEGLLGKCPDKCEKGSPLIRENQNNSTLKKSSESVSEYCKSQHNASAEFQG